MIILELTPMLAACSLQGSPSWGVSDVALDVERRVQDVARKIQSARSIGIADTIADLNALTTEHALDNWDGEGAKALRFESFRLAHAVLQSLPFGLRVPTVGVDTDGLVTLEWYHSPQWLFSITVGTGGVLYFAGLFGSDRVYGTTEFCREFPASLHEHASRAILE